MGPRDRRRQAEHASGGVDAGQASRRTSRTSRTSGRHAGLRGRTGPRILRRMVVRRQLGIAWGLWSLAAAVAGAGLAAAFARLAEVNAHRNPVAAAMLVGACASVPLLALAA